MWNAQCSVVVVCRNTIISGSPATEAVNNNVEEKKKEEKETVDGKEMVDGKEAENRVKNDDVYDIPVGELYMWIVYIIYVGYIYVFTDKGWVLGLP